MAGEPVRRSLDLTSWEAANRKIRELEIHGFEKTLSVVDAADRFLRDKEALQLSDAMQRKYKHVVEEIKREVGSLPIGSVAVDDVRRMRERWKLAPITAQKRLEMVRAFFAFCVESDWLGKNPAKRVRSAMVKHVPTLPYTEEQMERILWAAESIRIRPSPNAGRTGKEIEGAHPAHALFGDTDF